jgi:hypothetical protein
VLAQLEDRPDVETAEVDRRGALLRIRTRAPGTLALIREQLELMGFAAEEAPDAAAVAVRWYGRSSVGELSREEGSVIAGRVVPAFGAANGLGQAEIDALSTRVATALYECLVGHRDAGLASGGLAVPCGRAVEAATRARLGPDRAAVLGRAIEADLAGAARR